MIKSDNVGKCGHAKCAGGILCYEKGAPMTKWAPIYLCVGCGRNTVEVQYTNCETCAAEIDEAEE